MLAITFNNGFSKVRLKKSAMNGAEKNNAKNNTTLNAKLEIVKKSVGVIPLLLGIFIDIYWMLWGSVCTGLFAYYLNSYYSGKFLKYPMVSQIKDIYKSFGIAVVMALITYLVSLLPLSPFVLLPLQILVGIVVTIVLCECFKLEEYNELKGMAFSAVRKIIHR